MKNIIEKRRFAETLMIGIIVTMLLIPIINAIGISSDYNNENPANIAPGETKTINLLRLMSGSTDINNIVKIKAELIDGAGVATLVGNSEYSVSPSSNVNVPVKISIPKDAAEGTKYDITFKFTDITPTKEAGMISFTKTTTLTTSVFVKKPKEIPIVPEKPKGNYSWFIIVIALAIIIAIVAYLLLGKKATDSKK